MKKILITGGAGFVGSHLVDRLVKDKFKVTVIDNLSSGNINNLSKSFKKIDFIKIDISNYKKLEKSLKNKKFDYCVHLAALADIVPSINYPEDYFKANVEGTFNILNILKKQKISKIVYAASSSCYGFPNKFPTDENCILNPQYPYALTKRLGEELVEHWGHIYKIPFISLRFFNIYGPRSRTSGTYGAVLGVFLAQKLAKKPFTVVGNGKQTRDFTYVDDIVEAICSALNSNVENQIFNVGSGNTYSINYLTKLIGGKKIYIPKRPGEPDCTYADISKIKKVLKWKPKFSLEKGISEVINNISYWKDAPLWSPKTIKLATKDWFKYLS